LIALFMACLLPLESLAQGSDEFFIQRALSLDALVKEKHRFIDQLDENMTIDLPVGIKKTIGNVDYTVIIDSISFTREGGFMTTYMVIDLPGDDVLSFRGSNIRFSSKGGLSGEATMQLLGNRSLNIGKGATLELLGEGTKAVWDCEGFKMVQLDGLVLFDRSIMVPENEAGELLEGEVTASLQADIIDFSNLVVEISVDGFQLPQLPGFGIHAQSVVLDMSDLANASAMYFPKIYRDFYQEDISLWRGVSFRDLSIFLPPFIANSGERVEIAGSNILLDEYGFSGALQVKDILSLQQGSIDNWSLSVDDLRLRFLRNEVQEAALAGGLTLPIMKEGTDFRYRARIDDEGTLRFMVASEDLIELPALGSAKMLLYPSSRIYVSSTSGAATVNTRLAGALMMQPSESLGSSMDFGKIEFQDLEINSKAPFISGGVFDLSGSGRQVAGFPIALHKIGFNSTSGDITELQMGLGIGLSDSQGGAFSGSTRAVIRINTEDERRFRFEGLDIEKVRVDIDGGAFKMRGLVSHFKEDATYGDGFRGSVDATFAPDIKLEADLLFGRKDDFRFYYVSGNALFPTGVPFAGGVALYGISGGAMNKMKVEVSESGYLKYLPDPDRGLGFRAGIAIGTNPNRKAFNAEANLQMIFNQHGGLSEMTVEGVANFMEPPVSINQGYITTLTSDAFGGMNSKRGQISGELLMYYNPGLRTFHGNIKVFVNVVNGTIRGSGPQNLAGEAVLHFSPEDWYIHIGTPYQRIGLLFGLESMNAEADAYFMAGTQVHESPPPPEIIGSILGDSDLDYMRDFNALGSGQGFAFGSSFSMDTGEKQFLIFFARMQAGIGFDVMMKDYGNEVFCSGETDALGLNGWYANGQAYGYFQGAIGIKIDLPFASGKYKIMDIGSAILLQAQLPNPTWMKGTVGGYYELLNGLVKGNCRFRIEIGKKCDLGEYSALQGLKVISDMTPFDGQSEVDVFASPQVAFNLPVNEPFQIKDINEMEYEYRIDIEDISLYQQGLPVKGDIKLNYDHSVAALQTSDILASQSNYTFRASLIFMERSGSRWKPLVRAGKPIREEQQVTFKSGIAPDFIPNDNIDYAYPIPGDAYFHPGYGNEGYIKLKKGQPDLFNQEGMEQTADFVGSNKLELSSSVSYADGLIRFSIPELSRGDQYKLNIRSRPSDQASVDQNLEDSYVAVNESTEVLERNLSGNITLDVQKNLLEYEVNTSQFSTLSAKVPTWSVSNFYLESSDKWYLKNLVTGYDGVEGLGANEGSASGVITATALLTSSDYYNDDVYPLVYEGYPLEGQMVVGRDPAMLGVPPVKAIKLSASSTGTKVSWNLTPVMAQDFIDIQKQVVRKYINSRNVNERFRRIILERYPVVMFGNFDVLLQYRLPGSQKVVDQAPLRFFLPKEY